MHASCRASAQSGALLKSLLGWIAVGVLTVIPFAVPVKAATTYFALLDGASENPSVPTAGTGSATVIIDDVTNWMRVIVIFSELTGITTAAHIHCCAPPPTNVGVATQTPSFIGFPLSVTSGTMDVIFDMTDPASFSASFLASSGGTPAGAFAALIAGLDSGQAYFNIHSSFRPSGEIRGFLAETPVPAALPLFASGLGMVGWLSLRRRRKASAKG